MNIKRQDWELFLLSMIALFLELAVIRWLSSEIRIFAYFKNLPLMGAFVGFGVGFLLYERAGKLLDWFPRLLFALVVIIAGAKGFGLTHIVFVDPREFFLLGVGLGDHAETAPSLLKMLKGLGVIVGMFFLVVATFAALTAKLGELLNREKPLVAYSINVAGSLAGILAFTLASYLQTGPFVWLSFSLVPLWLLLYRDRGRKPAFYFTTLIFSSILFGYVNPAIWSPYYRISIYDEGQHVGVPAFHIMVNYDGFQSVQDLSTEGLSKFPPEAQRILSRHYNLPYALSRRPVESVLILGGGAGNDAAAALRNGAKRVDVVEIDPVIAQIGRALHPEKPYSSERLRLHVDDARSFLQRTGDKYDLVIFATLDSHAAFSSMSSLRMDNFVFTEESIERVRALLNPGGGIAINFFAIKPWLTQRHYNTLAKDAEAPLLAYASPANDEVIFLAGELFDGGRDVGLSDYVPVQGPFAPGYVEPTTDDWPFLFLEERGVPFQYVLPLLLIVALAIVPLRFAEVKLGEVNWQLFFMGAAFLLIETHAVTSLALIFGSTWLVNSIVIGSIMVMILVANFAIVRMPAVGFPVLYAALAATLLFNFAFSLDALNHLSWGARLAAAGTVISMPLFFAALIFAKAFAVVESPSKALAANLFGSLLGGVLEYLDMWTGLSWLSVVALFLYGLSALALYMRMRAVPAANPRGAHALGA
jgi:SAM-dependent methyltransferase